MSAVERRSAAIRGAALAEPVPMGEDERWAAASIDELIDHIIETYHRPLPAALDQACALARQPIAGLVAADRARLDRAAAALDELRETELAHLRQEEDLVFPWLRSRDRASAGVLVNVLGRDHADITRLLREVRALIAPIAAVRVLVEAVDRLAAACRDHLALENGVLFPRALASTQF
jgi:iron-sulfur cluster repair protein YtfE (RIC family)